MKLFALTVMLVVIIGPINLGILVFLLYTKRLRWPTRSILKLLPVCLCFLVVRPAVFLLVCTGFFGTYKLGLGAIVIPAVFLPLGGAITVVLLNQMFCEKLFLQRLAYVIGYGVVATFADIVLLFLLRLLIVINGDVDMRLVF